MLFAAHLINRGIKSTTLKLYISAIKCILIDDTYKWDDGKMLLRSLSRACRRTNDKLSVRLPIHLNLLEIILFEIQCYYYQQEYLTILYQTIFCIAYYGLFRVGEVATGTHPIKARDVHIGTNKDKLLFVLYSSKTHGKESRPQKVKVKARNITLGNSSNTKNRFFFCPFTLSRKYLALCGQYMNENDSFFVFRDHTPVTPEQVNKVLKSMIKTINLDDKVYSFHSLRIGRASDMMKAGYTIDQIKIAGRWKSNAVFKYIH